MIEFSDDDAAFLRWRDENPSGFFLNVRAKRDPGYVVLHRSTCRALPPRRAPGEDVYTGRGYRKVAALEVKALRLAAIAQGRADGTFSKACGRCVPL